MNSYRFTPRPMDSISLKGITFIGPHGWTFEERAQGVHFSVDVTIHQDLAVAGRSDVISDTVDWRKIAAAVTRVGKERSFRLVERLAEAMAAEVLMFCPEGAQVSILVEKTLTCLEGGPTKAQVHIHRFR